MNRLPFTEEYLLKTYKKEISDLLDACDWIDWIEDWRMISVIGDICRKKGLIIDTEYVGKAYEEKVKSLNLTTEQWREQYGDWYTGVPKIIKMIYEILENNHQ